MRPKHTTTTRKSGTANDALIAALLRGVGSVPPTGAATDEQIQRAGWELFLEGEANLWRRYEVEARQRAREWGWLGTWDPETGNEYPNGAPDLLFWGELWDWNRQQREHE
jgi:hypothetical protein